MKKKYVIIRLWRGSHVQTVGAPQTKKEAESRCAKLNETASTFTKYEVHNIGNTKKRVTLI